MPARKFGPQQAVAAVRWLAEQWADEHPRGYEVTVEPVAEPQTLKQRGQYWSALHEFGEHCGYTRRESEVIIHEELLRSTFGVYETRDLFGRLRTLPRQRSANAHRTDYSALIEALIRLAADHGYVIDTAA